MLLWSVIFLVISIVAGVLGYTGIAKKTAGVAKVIFFVALGLFVISLGFKLMVL